jgi:GNAT superfamily N-acetyltransferase
MARDIVTSENREEFMAKKMGMEDEDKLQELIKKAKKEKVQIEIKENDEGLKLGLIKVHEKERNKGLGTKYMENLKEYANDVKKPLDLNPDYGQSKDTNPERLDSFYKKLGFNKYENESKSEQKSGLKKFKPTVLRYSPKKSK